MLPDRQRLYLSVLPIISHYFSYNRCNDPIRSLQRVTGATIRSDRCSDPITLPRPRPHSRTFLLSATIPAMSNGCNYPTESLQRANHFSKLKTLDVITATAMTGST
jgi:hypothetical protein